MSRQLGEVHWDTSFPAHHDAWRAYQSRETDVAALSVIWSCFLELLDEHNGRHGSDIRNQLVDMADWPSIGVTAPSPVADLIASGVKRYGEKPADLIESIDSAMGAFKSGQCDEALALAFGVLGWVGNGSEGDEQFRLLLGSGGNDQLSFEFMHRWISTRSGQTIETFARELVDLLVFRHFRVATMKLSQTDKRDPFCLSQDEDGRLHLVRPDEPFWTGARWDTLNHLLWTLGALDSPSGDGRPTELGLELLSEVRASV